MTMKTGPKSEFTGRLIDGHQSLLKYPPHWRAKPAACRRLKVTLSLRRLNFTVFHYHALQLKSDVFQEMASRPEIVFPRGYPRSGEAENRI